MLTRDAPVRVLIADDHELVRLGLRSVLEEAGFDVMGEACSGEEAVRIASELRPDVVLMDLRMPGMGGVEACEALRSSAPEVCVVVLTSFAEDDEVFGALAAGASSYIMKDVSPDVLVRTIKGAASGQTVLDSSVAQRVIEGPRTLPAPCQDMLSSREREVLGLLAEGLTNRQIAARLWISEPTVKTHVSHILAKLDQPDRTQAIVYAMRCGLVSPPERQ